MLRQIDPNEDRNFRNGETIYDVDGNAYTVENGKAVLRRGNCSTSYFLGREMRKCFTREVPPRIRCSGCGISVLTSSDDKSGLCSSCKRARS